MTRLALPLLASALLALSGCGPGAPDSEPDAVATDPATPAPAPAPAPAASPDAPSAIPVAIRGRWGMVPTDCEPGRADAKGLLTIDARTLEFYESVGTLGAIEQADANAIRARFAFMGEGMEWTRDVALQVEDGGAVLVRREYGGEEGAGPFRYSKCN